MLENKIKKKAIGHLEDRIYFEGLKKENKEMSFMEFLVTHSSKTHLYGSPLSPQDLTDLILLLSSNRSEYLADYISVIECYDAIYLENIIKYLKVKYDSILAMVTREKLTTKQYRNKWIDTTKDIVSYFCLSFCPLIKLTRRIF